MGISQKHEHIIADIVDAFQHGKRLKIDLTWQATGVHVKPDDSFLKPSEFVCYLNGHRHGDDLGYLAGFPKQLSIGMTCSVCFPENYHNIGAEVSELPRIPDTVSEDCVNFYTIDKEKRTISVFRLSAVVTDEVKVRRVLWLYD